MLHLRKLWEKNNTTKLSQSYVKIILRTPKLLKHAKLQISHLYSSKHAKSSPVLGRGASQGEADQEILRSTKEASAGCQQQGSTFKGTKLYCLG